MSIVQEVTIKIWTRPKEYLGESIEIVNQPTLERVGELLGRPQNFAERPSGGDGIVHRASFNKVPRLNNEKRIGRHVHDALFNGTRDACF